MDALDAQRRASLYEWIRLSPERREIRLLTILPSKYIADQVCCTIRRVSLEASPQYDALSYTWGDSGAFSRPTESSLEPCEITLEGKPFPVTSNLNEALRFFREATQPRDLWVDAVCINQDDIPEKNHQVSQMRVTYLSATRVLIWLGTDNLHSNEALEFIGNFDEYVVNNLDPEIQASPGFWPVPKGFVMIREGGEEPLRRGRLLLRYIEERTWWSRIWVVQELALARDDPLVYCGRESLAWSRVDAWATWEAATRSQPWGEGTQMHTMAIIRKSQQQNPTGERLITLLRNATNKFSSTDPRDKIYALLGLATEKDREAILIDYSKPVVDIYTETVQHIIYSEQKLQIIGCIHSSKRPLLPSWVPDFSPREYPSTGMLSPYGLSDKYYAAGKTKPNVQFQTSEDGMKVMIAEGLYHATVETVLEGGFNGSNMDSIGLDLMRLVLAIAGSMPEEHRERGEELLQGIWRTCITDIGHKGEFPASGDFGMMFCTLIGLWEVPNDWVDPMEQTGQFTDLVDGELELIRIKNYTKPFREALRYFTAGRKFYISSFGHLGLGPRSVEKGDEIVILFGGHVPYLLRKDSNRYRLVGESFVDGLMEGAWEEACKEVFDNPEVRREFVIC
jgi:Heterokaryon incompatibility protein (HET)